MDAVSENTFIHETGLGVDIKSNGLLSAVPYLTVSVLAIPMGYISDFILNRKWMSVTICRKIFNSIALFGPAIGLIGLCFVPANTTVSVTVLSLTVGLSAGFFSGDVLVFLDIAPNFASIMMGISHFIGTVIALNAPLVAGLFIDDEEDPRQWHTVLYLTSGIFIITNILFLIFGTSDRQKWDPLDDQDNEGLGVRHAQTLLLFVAMLLAFTMRVNMSLAIVDMTNKEAASEEHHYYAWDHSTQSVILSSFFWGYVVLQIPAGELASRFGGKLLITIAVAVNSLLSIVIPYGAVLGGWKLVCACRVLQGLTQAFVFPSMHHLVSQWIPLQEKGLLATIIYAGGQLGIALQLIASGFLATGLGWQAIFYANGVLGLLWTAAYLYFGSSCPEQSKLISEEELRYIQNSLGRVGEHKRYPTPWRHIVTSLPFWAVNVAHCGQNWGFFTLMTEMPTYMAKVLGMDLKSNGVLSSFPYLAMYILSFPMGALTDLIIRKKWLNVSNCRKLFNSIGLWGPAIAMIGLSYTSADNKILAVAMLTITVGINAGQYTGYMLVHIDLAPNFSACLMGITNCTANIISIIAPLVCGFIVTDETDPTEWRKVFFVASGVYFFTNLFFVLFSTSELQPWNEPKKTDEDLEMKRQEKAVTKR